MTPSGEEFTGISVTIGGVTDPSEVKRTYDDIEAIFKSNEQTFKTHETDDAMGHFRTYTVSTS